ncbi:MAG: two pore domain potassium channel family protein [Anaerolineaceae bacterium]|nr:two pore domain potassium channel family protein [Anaerolineaceae bacterium]
MTQLLLLILYAIFDGVHSGRSLISAVGLIALVLVVWVVDRSPGFNLIAWLLVIPGFILSILSAVYLNPILIIWSSIIQALLYFYAAGSLIAYMMEDNQVTVDELFAAGSTYTLLAWGFAYVYLVCQTILPGSFVNGTGSPQTYTFLELLFLSFTNLSATGLSDILPGTSAARVVIMLEQFSGIGYVAVVVSRLIGLTISRYKRRHE